MMSDEVDRANQEVEYSLAEALRKNRTTAVGMLACSHSSAYHIKRTYEKKTGVSR